MAMGMLWPLVGNAEMPHFMSAFGDIANRTRFVCRLGRFCQVKQQSLDLLKRRDEKDDLVEPDLSMKSWRHCEE